MATAEKGSTVKVHYTGKLEDGTIFDSSKERAPLEFTIGEGTVIPGFEAAVIGMQTGESKSATVPPEDAYGERRSDRLLTVDLEQLPDDLDPEVGQQLELKQPDGRKVPVTVARVSDSHVTLDANHPLAGRELAFEMELVEIR
jgi:FKBP-type peptidyl-prolyl cis-trans isomerase 2